MRYIFPSTYEDADAMKLLNEWPRAEHVPLVNIAPAAQSRVVEEVAGD